MDNVEILDGADMGLDQHPCIPCPCTDSSEASHKYIRVPMTSSHLHGTIAISNACPANHALRALVMYHALCVLHWPRCFLVSIREFSGRASDQCINASPLQPNVLALERIVNAHLSRPGTSAPLLPSALPFAEYSYCHNGQYHTATRI
jgi:hypothetical protein